MAAPSKVTLKLLIDKKANKVLFAEAGKEAVDFLCSVLTLPVGTVISLLYEQGMAGCLQNLYQSIENLDEHYILPNQHKDTVLKPMAYNSVGQAPQFLLTQKKSEAMKLYSCTKDYDVFNGYCCDGYYVTSVRGTECPYCNRPMTTDLTFVEGKKEAAGKVAVGGGGGEGVVTYMLMDDLVVSPMFTITGITLLTKFIVKDGGALEEKVVDLNMAKGLKLLKTSFKSKNVLTEVFL